MSARDAVAAREAAFEAWFETSSPLALSHDWAAGYWRMGWFSFPGDRPRHVLSGDSRIAYLAGRRAARAHAHARATAAAQGGGESGS